MNKFLREIKRKKSHLKDVIEKTNDKDLRRELERKLKEYDDLFWGSRKEI